MPFDQRRRDEIADAVAAYDQANPLTQLPRNAARLLAAMFPASDVCQLSLETIAAAGFSQRSLPGTLERLVKARILSRERSSARIADTYHLHLPPLVRR
jgi:hypothetical protein